MESREHIIEYDNFCNNCKYKDLPDGAIPCDECLTNPVNTDSRRPIKYEPTEEWKQKEKIQKERIKLASKSRLKRNKED